MNHTAAGSSASADARPTPLNMLRPPLITPALSTVQRVPLQLRTRLPWWALMLIIGFTLEAVCFGVVALLASAALLIVGLAAFAPLFIEFGRSKGIVQ